MSGEEDSISEEDLTSDDDVTNIKQVTEEDVIESLFVTCDMDNSGFVPVSRLIDYLRVTTGSISENGEDLKLLSFMFDPDGEDCVVDIEKYKEVMPQWIEKIRSRSDTGSELDDASDGAKDCATLGVRPYMGTDILAVEDCHHKTLDTVELQNKLGDMQLQNCRLTEEITRLQQHLDHQETSQFQTRRLMEENSKLQQQLDSQEEIISHSSTEINTLRRKIKSMQEIVDLRTQTQMENEELKVTLSKLHESRRELQHKVGHSEKNILSLEMNIAELEKKIQILSEQKENVTATNKELYKSVTTYKRKIAQLNEDKNVLDYQHSVKSTEVTELKNQVQRLEKTNSDLKTEKSDLQTELKEIQLTSAQLKCGGFGITDDIPYTLNDDKIPSPEHSPHTYIVCSTPVKPSNSICMELKNMLNTDKHLPSPLCEKGAFPEPYDNTYMSYLYTEEEKENSSDNILSVSYKDDLTFDVSNFCEKYEQKQSEVAKEIENFVLGLQKEDIDTTTAAKFVQKLKTKMRKLLGRFVSVVRAKELSDKRLDDVQEKLQKVTEENVMLKGTAGFELDKDFDYCVDNRILLLKSKLDEERTRNHKLAKLLKSKEKALSFSGIKRNELIIGDQLGGEKILKAEIRRLKRANKDLTQRNHVNEVKMKAYKMEVNRLHMEEKGNKCGDRNQDSKIERGSPSTSDDNVWHSPSVGSRGMASSDDIHKCSSENSLNRKDRIKNYAHHLWLDLDCDENINLKNSSFNEMSQHENLELGNTSNACVDNSQNNKLSPRDGSVSPKCRRPSYEAAIANQNQEGNDGQNNNLPSCRRYSFQAAVESGQKTPESESFGLPSLSTSLHSVQKSSSTLPSYVNSLCPQNNKNSSNKNSVRTSFVTDMDFTVNSNYLRCTDSSHNHSSSYCEDMEDRTHLKDRKTQPIAGDVLTFDQKSWRDQAKRANTFNSSSSSGEVSGPLCSDSSSSGPANNLSALAEEDYQSDLKGENKSFITNTDTVNTYHQSLGGPGSSISAAAVVGVCCTDDLHCQISHSSNGNRNFKKHRECKLEACRSIEEETEISTGRSPEIRRGNCQSANLKSATPESTWGCVAQTEENERLMDETGTPNSLNHSVSSQLSNQLQKLTLHDKDTKSAQMEGEEDEQSQQASEDTTGKLGGNPLAKLREAGYYEDDAKKLWLTRWIEKHFETDTEVDFVSAPFLMDRIHLYEGYEDPTHFFRPALRSLLVHHILINIDIRTKEEKNSKIEVNELGEIRRVKSSSKKDVEEGSCRARCSCLPCITKTKNQDSVLAKVEISKEEADEESYYIPGKIHSLPYLLMKGVYSDSFILHEESAVKDDKDALKEKYFKDKNVALADDGQSKEELEIDPRKDLNETWKRVWKFQPLWKIRNYFGEMIAFYFAWVGEMTSSLWIPTLFGFAIFLYGLVLSIIDDTPDAVIPANATLSEKIQLEVSALLDTVKQSFDNNVTPFFAMVICLWGTVFLERWKRKNATLAYEWDVDNFEQNEPDRPQFYGLKVKMDPVTMEPNWFYPFKRQLLKYFVSSSTLIFMVFLVLISVTGVILYRVFVTIDICPGMNAAECLILSSILSALLNAVSILILGKLYEILAIKLTDWENHRTQTRYDNALITKMFAFQFVNSYASCFYIAFLRGKFEVFGYTDECKGETGTCMSQLSFQVFALMIVRPFPRFFKDIILPLIKKLIILRPNWCCRIRACPCNFCNKLNKVFAGDAEDKMEANKILLASYLERERLKPSLGDFTLNEYTEKVIQYGFLMLFAASFPLAPLLALLLNLIDIRVDSHRLLWFCRRPIAFIRGDIGKWFGILEFVNVIGVITNGFLIAFSSTWAQQFETTTRLWIAIGFEHIVFSLKFLLDYLIPDVPREVSLAIRREKYQVARILEESKGTDPVDYATLVPEYKKKRKHRSSNYDTFGQDDFKVNEDIPEEPENTVVEEQEKKSLSKQDSEEKEKWYYTDKNGIETPTPVISYPSDFEETSTPRKSPSQAASVSGVDVQQSGQMSMTDLRSYTKGK